MQCNFSKIIKGVTSRGYTLFNITLKLIKSLRFRRLFSFFIGRFLVPEEKIVIYSAAIFFTAARQSPKGG